MVEAQIADDWEASDRKLHKASVVAIKRFVREHRGQAVCCFFFDCDDPRLGQVVWNAASDDWHTTAASVDLRVGGQFSSRMEAKDGSFGFDFAGKYTSVVPNKRLEHSFGDRNATVEFDAAEGGVLVRVTFDAEDTHSVDQQRDGWQAILNNFARHVEHKA